jgi:hypothetical protein
MRPLYLAVLLALTGLVAACDQKKALEDQARAAVIQAMPDAMPTVDVLHTDPATGAVCGAATVQDAASGAAVPRPFILKGGAVKLYGAPPDWTVIRQLANMDSGGDQAAYRLQIDQGCGFPAVWKQACGDAAAPIPAPDPELCRLWNADDYQKLFDHVRQ